MSQQRPEQHLRSVIDQTRGILFLGTPHHGAGLAQWAEKLARHLGVVTQTNHKILEVLKADSEVLARIQDGFQTMIRTLEKNGTSKVQITCFYEELPMPVVGLVSNSNLSLLRF